MKKRPRTLPEFEIGALHVKTDVRPYVPAREIEHAVRRHRRGNWGNITARERRLNNDAVVHGGPIRSVHMASTGTCFAVLTEATRLDTTVFLVDD